MSIIDGIKKWYHNTFIDPEVYSNIAERLNRGTPALRAKFYGHYDQPRYYTGSGNRNGSGRGLKARWMVDVHKFVTCEDGFVRILTTTPMIDRTELELLQSAEVYEQEAYESHGLSTAELKEILINIARRLKPGQGYRYRGMTIIQDFIRPDGYLVHINKGKLVITEDQLTLPFVFTADGDDTFDPSKVFVFDQDVIKRQHRPVTDLKRWIVPTKLNSIEDDWVISYTHHNTAGEQVAYYGLDIVIDAKSMKGHPFYITELVNAALAEIKSKHKGGHYDLHVDRIKIQWAGKTYTLNEWLTKAEKFPTFKDESPVVIFKDLETRARIHHYEPTFWEVA